MFTRNKTTFWLILGDLAAALVVALIGFLTHYGKIEGWRWLSSYVPVVVGWLAIAPWLGVYRAETANRPVQVWRAGLAAFLSAPLAAWLRGAWLNTPILPLFVLVLGLTDALGFLVWRGLWAVGNTWKKRHG
jgi:hypothetical protein